MLFRAELAEEGFAAGAESLDVCMMAGSRQRFGSCTCAIPAVHADITASECDARNTWGVGRMKPKIGVSELAQCRSH